MIKVSFQYDSTDPQASSFFNWLSAFPLETTSIRLNTSIDIIESGRTKNGQDTHHIGNIVLESRKDDNTLNSQRGASGIKGVFGGGWLSGVGKRKAAVTQDKASQFVDRSDADVSQPSKVMAFSSKSMESSIVKPESVSEVSSDNSSAFDSDMDDFLLNDVLFSDEEISIDDDLNKAEPAIERNDELMSESFTMEGDLNLSEAFDAGESETLDFLLGALDEFNQE